MVLYLLLLILIVIISLLFSKRYIGGFDKRYWNLERVIGVNIDAPECLNILPPGPDYVQLANQIKTNLGTTAGIELHVAGVDDYLKKVGKGLVKEKPIYDSKKIQVIDLQNNPSQPTYNINNEDINDDDINRWMSTQEKSWKPGVMGWRGHDDTQPLAASDWGNNVLWDNGTMPDGSQIPQAKKIQYEKIIYAWTRFHENMYRHINESYWRYPSININGTYYRYTIQTKEMLKQGANPFAQIAGGKIKCLKVIIVNNLINTLVEALKALRTIHINGEPLYIYNGQSERYQPDNFVSEIPLLRSAINHGLYADEHYPNNIFIPPDKYANVTHTFNQFVATADRQSLEKFELTDPKKIFDAKEAYDHNVLQLEKIGSHYMNYKIPPDQRIPGEPERTTKYTFIMNGAGTILPACLTESIENEVLITPGTNFVLKGLTSKSDGRSFTIEYVFLDLTYANNAGKNALLNDKKTYKVHEIDEFNEDDIDYGTPLADANCFGKKIIEELYKKTTTLEKNLINNKLSDFLDTATNSTKHYFDQRLSLLKDELNAELLALQGNPENKKKIESIQSRLLIINNFINSNRLNGHLLQHLPAGLPVHVIAPVVYVPPEGAHAANLLPPIIPAGPPIVLPGGVLPLQPPGGLGLGVPPPPPPPGGAHAANLLPPIIPAGPPIVPGPPIIVEDEYDENIDIWKQRLENPQRLYNDNVFKKIISTMITKADRIEHKKIRNIHDGNNTLDNLIMKLNKILTKFGSKKVIKSRRDIIEQYINLLKIHPNLKLISMQDLRQIGLN